MYDICDLRVDDVRRELDPGCERVVSFKVLCEDVEEGYERRPSGVVRRGRAGGDVGAARVELDCDARSPALVGCAEALDGVEHEAEVGRMGFGDADDERFGGGWGAFEERADPAAGADVAEERVWGVAVGVEGGERAFQECRLDGVSGHLEKRYRGGFTV